MKKIIFALIVLAGTTISCTKNFEDFNTDKKRASEVPGDFLFSNAQKALADQVGGVNVNLNIFNLWAQYWTETTYTDEANYDLVTRNISDAQFRILYRDILADLKEAKRLLELETAAGEEGEAIKQNKINIATLVENYAWNYLLLIFGDIPYQEALAEDNNLAVYDDARTILNDLIQKTKDATAALNPDFESFGNADIVFAGDVASWQKFGYSLQIKMSIVLADVDASLAQSTIEGAYQAAFQPGESAQVVYPGGTNSNPIWQELVATGRDDFVGANTIIDIMNDLEDPRRDDYFTTVGDTTDIYEGGIYGETSPFGQLSHVADPIQDPTFPVTLLDYTEIAFYLAESAERGYSVGMSAEEWYNEGITSSILSWGGTQEEADAYLANPDVNYATAEGTWQQKIGTQAWLAFYLRGLEGWTSWRRLDFPIFNIPPGIDTYGEIPLRFTYPITEQTLNADNFNAAASAIGGDELTTPLFWDVQ
ncbi:MAG TPA: SusD/RagB family nutrient-binding outer membrane lipoprotein [Lentimicrobium sp.]|nr:SusD/RagB family nutrient-binding outer membrane lipoprotein [Lentimicrobium sp.]